MLLKYEIGSPNTGNSDSRGSTDTIIRYNTRSQELYRPRTSQSIEELRKFLKNEHITTKERAPSLDKLPFEIRLKVANQLSQFDCLNLLRTNRAMYSSTIPRLYQHIIIDQNYSQFNKEYDFRHYIFMDDFNDYEDFSCSYIKSSYNFKRFLQYYLRMHQSLENNNAKFNKFGPSASYPYIRKIQCIDLPDSLNIYDYELNENLNNFFGKLTHLKELVWLNDNFRLEYLEMLPNYLSITTLVLNIKFSNYLSEFHSPTGLEFGSLEADDNSGKLMIFPNLINFQIRPFQNSNRLIKIINNLLISCKPDIISEHLRILKLSRFDKDISVLVPPSQNLVTTSEISELNELDLGTINALFVRSELKYLNNLSILLFNNCLLTPDDSQTLINSVNLSNLKTLELKNISEYQRIHETVSNAEEVISYLQKSFIVKIAPFLSSLEHLCIDYRESLTDSVPDFLKSIASDNLKSLDLTIRFNQSKLNSFNNDINEFYSAYSNAIISGNKCKTLVKLSIETKEENTFCDLSIPIPSNFFYEELGNCLNLKSLRINPSECSEKIVTLIRNLPKLTKLDVFGSHAGGAPHLGSAMVHPTVYDEWFRVQDAATLYLKYNPNLKYVRINKCTFECIGDLLQVIPRDGIDRWFNEHVRVGFNIDE